METYNYNFEEEDTGTVIDNGYNYYFGETPVSMDICSQEVIDYIKLGGDFPDHIDIFDVKRTLSVIAGSDMSDKAIERFMAINELLSEDEIPVREELIAPRDMLSYLSKKVNYIDYDNAACKDAKRELFFPSASNKSQVSAKRLCSTCPEKENCLRNAIENNEDGIWGGTNKTERVELLSKNQQAS